MITLSPGSLCDVCAEEYGPHNYPHCIPCGHVLCRSCCNTILSKATPKTSPSCPFCREHFASDTVRLIRIDFSPNSSGWSTPRQCTAASAHGIVDDTVDDDDPLQANLNRRAEVKRLEQKVARVAEKKCSVEEVTTLHRELQDWLSAHGYVEKATSLRLSSSLLRAILMNHMAHSEAIKAARDTESNLKDEVEHLRVSNDKKDSEIRKYRSHFSQVPDSYSLHSELNRYKTGNKSPVSPPRPSSTMPSVSPTSSASTSRATSPTSPSPYKPTLHSPLASRLSPMTHARSASVAPPSVPSIPARSPSVAPTGHMRSASVAPPSVPSFRSMTPSIRSKTPAVGIQRSESVRPEKASRKLSISSSAVPKMFRSSSGESSSDEIQKDKQAAYAKDIIRPKYAQWFPSDKASPPTGYPLRSRTMSIATPPRSARTPAPR
ncbi:hypothetical protein QCA50_004940 [Cerrena zonata]|uniref:RING-type domain-containing protein n=1 Tax=Cerrena zonata TaxID=2478898 RepID=A0AAW0GFN5_9APHY